LRRVLFAGGAVIFLVAGFVICRLFYAHPAIEYPPELTKIDKAALKAEQMQSKELREVIEALRKKEAGRTIWGDRFLRWTVLAYTLWRIDQGDLSIVRTMEDLMTSYYERAWYQNVKRAPPMPFPSLIQYFRADGTWEDYWNDYKPVYCSAFLLEYYLLSSFDRDWGIRNYAMLRNVADSLVSMWLPARHQPTAYVDASEVGGISFVDFKNITSSVDSAMVYSSLVASAQIAKELAKDIERFEKYTSYANEMISHFYNQAWDWFPTATFGANPSEAYGTAIQIGMTLPYVDGDEKIDDLKDYVFKNLMLDERSWLLKWRKEDTSASSRSMLVAVGLAPKYSSLAYQILDAYAEAALSNDPWLLTKTDGYEAQDPIWLSGKYLFTYVLMKDRALTGRTPFSPKLMKGDLSFETSFSVEPTQVESARALIPTLSHVIDVSANRTELKLRYAIAGINGQNVSILFQLRSKATIRSDASKWGFAESSLFKGVIVWVVPDRRAEITIDLA